MTLADRLLRVTRLGLDTPPFIYFVERHPSYLPLVRAVIRAIDRRQFTGYSSAVTLVEVLTLPKRVGTQPLVDEYKDLLLESRNFELVPLDEVMAERAADLRAAYNLRTPDATQLAAALHHACEAFLTNDAGLKRVTELRVLVLDELTL